MRSSRCTLLPALALVLLALHAAPARAQSFGVGGRLSMIRFDNVDSSVRYFGGQMRAHLSPRTAVEVSLDVHTTHSDDLTTRVRDMPIQASMLLFPVNAPFAPYVLGGAGWYSHKVELLAGDETIASASSRDFGWHAGFGAEIKMGAHAGLHADYRYTFLGYGDDDEDADAILTPVETERRGGKWFLPYYRGSMWTAGMTFYF